MTEKINVTQQLDFLIGLQEIDSQIYRLDAEKDAKPDEINRIKDSIGRKESALQEAVSSLKVLQLKHKEKEIELLSKEDEVKKLQAKLYLIKTNKEYTAMMHEIEGHKADNSVLEDGILKLMEEIDSAGSKVREEKDRFAEKSKELDAEVKAIEERVKEIEAIVTELKNKREQITPSINPRTLKDYERTLAGKKGLALVEVVNDACGGCNMLMPPQVINEIRMKDKIVFCESCRCMLYIKDDPA